MTIKIAGLTVREFSNQYKIGESTIYAAYKRNGQEGVIDLLTKLKARQISKLNEQEKRDIRQSFISLQKLIKDSKAQKQISTLKKQVHFYQLATAILAIALSILSI